MSDFVDLTGNSSEIKVNNGKKSLSKFESKSNVPSYDNLQLQLAESSKLVDDVVLKNYLTKLTSLEITPLDNSLKQISDIRLFKISEMVYQKDEYSTYKFASVFNAVQNLNCGVFVIADSNGKKTEFYMGVRSFDDKRTTKSLKDTLRNALSGQFPGVKTIDLLDSEAEEFLSDIQSKNIAAVSCVAKNKDEEFKDNQKFIQGLEKLALAMEGQSYTAVLLAKSTPTEQLKVTRHAYEEIYTQLSPFANLQLSYGTNTALSISDAFSEGRTSGTSHTSSVSNQTGESYSKGKSNNQSLTKPDGSAIKIILKNWIGYGASTTTTGTSTSENWSKNKSKTEGTSDSTNESSSNNKTKTQGLTSGTSDNMQLTMQNKTLINTLERIDLQLKRIEECESLGMWESAAYFLSDSQETTEMAAGTYKALMKGEKSGIEISAINFWGRQNIKKTAILRDYITNFIHPVFEYHSTSAVIPVTASSLISGNELAIQMGLPRKSVCGFPVIEHADFGKEVVKYNQRKNEREIALGKVFNMGTVKPTDVRLSLDSLTMHTFITGSTGSGKSNTVYEMLNQLRKAYNIPFLVVEPAKGEYKNVFGQFSDVSVYGTNPMKSDLLRINPFRFPSDIHVLEHLDRLVEMFNVCWPMYAAMPAILKEAMEKAYIATGWNINKSENPKGNIFPNFADLLEQIENVINESKYSTDSKGDYSGALLTRVRALTNGINGLIFCKDDLSDEELFDNSVIVDLSRVGSIETKSLIMGLLVMKLNEYRMCSGDSNSPLKHITVLEEAHNLLKRTSTEQSSEGSNLLGKSVELLANSIAEMRTYGEGFIIADQAPGLLDLSVIRNTNTKIILRLPEQSDRELVGLAASLDEEQLEELSKLERGVAAVYQNDWIEPVLVKVDKCNIAEKTYCNEKNLEQIDSLDIRNQMISLLMQGRVSKKLNFDIAKIECGIDLLGLSNKNREFVEEQIAEFKKEGKLSIWSDENFRKLSRNVTNLLDARSKVENCVLTSQNNAELTERLAKIVSDSIPEVVNDVSLAISQCLMKGVSTEKEEIEFREEIYKKWIDYVQERIL